MFSKIGFKAVILLGLLQIVNYAHAQRDASQCGTCMDNMAKCINDREFYFCADGENAGEEIQTCAEDEYCTNTNDICVSRATGTPACTACNECAAYGGRPSQSCISETDYTICIGGAPSNLVNTCPEGQVCNVEFLKMMGEICAPLNILEFFGQSSSTCGGSGSGGPSITPPTQAEQRRLCRNAAESSTNTSARFYYIRNSFDATCRSYIYCEPTDNDGMATLFFTCNTGFFDEEERACVANRPASC